RFAGEVTLNSLSREAGEGRGGGVARLLSACLASLLLYGFAFGLVLDRPLSLGFLRQQIDAKLARAASITEPKLVILAGSNAPYSHRCETIEPILHMPCVNGGVAVGIGLDYLFARWQQVLRAGDIVYLPMEQAQYTRPATATGPDAAILFRHDWRTLASLAPQRWLSGLFAWDLRSALMAPIEALLVAARFHDPRAEATGATNRWGDHVGHTATLAQASRSVLATTAPYHTSASAIRNGAGSQQIAAFTRWACAHGVQVIGGLPTGFDDVPMPELDAMTSVYTENGGGFLVLPNFSRYPRSAFFDTAEHLNEAWQVEHSRLLAERLRWRRATIAATRLADPADPLARRNTPTE
ncbi:MAG TPA: hypothetical protein VFL55_10315, partial [Acetobacteraceae bacterium]|nr:hypothetical protein [Acetobacteraceae bacterium]